MMAIVVGCLGFLAVPIALVLTRACGGLKPADQPDPPLPPWVSAVARVLMPLLWIVGALAVGFYVVAVVFGAVAWAAPYVFPALLLGGLSFVTTFLAAPGTTCLAILVLWALVSLIRIPGILLDRDRGRFARGYPPGGPQRRQRHPVVSFIAAPPYVGQPPRRPEDRRWWVRVLRGLAGYALLLAGIFLVMAVTSGPHPLFGPDRGYSPRHGCSIGSHYDGMGGCLNDPPVHHAEPLDLQLTG